MRKTSLKGAMVTLVALAAVTLAATPARAVPLGPGDSTPFVPVEFLDPDAVRLDQIINQPISGVLWSGSYTTAVYQDPVNPFCVGCLTFLYQSFNDLASETDWGRHEAFSFLGWQTWVAQNPGPYDGIFDFGDVPASAADRGVSGDEIGFDFGPPPLEINPGLRSWIMIIRTDALNYEPGWFSAINGGTDTDVAFQPAPAVDVPEPGTLMLLGFGLLGVAGFIRRSTRGPHDSV